MSHPLHPRDIPGSQAGLHPPSSQRAPPTPGGQRQAPVVGSQVPPFRQPQEKLQFFPKVSGGHAVGGTAKREGRQPAG